MQDYSSTLDFLYTQLPMYQRVGKTAFKKDLTNIRALLAALGNPHEQIASIHVGGTNGKGSVAHLLSAALQANGLRTGLYTSPHYKDFRERIRINGAYVPRSFVVDFVEEIRPVLAEIRPSFFEITVAMAFSYFARQQVDIAVVEVGLGGRLDSTNVLTPELAVITNISMDHQQFLGDTLPLIAGEKAGIIKEGIPVVIGETHEETAPVFREKARSVHAPLYFADQRYWVELVRSDLHHSWYRVARDQQAYVPELKVNLGGPYQHLNVQTALMALEIWQQHQENRFLPYQAIEEGWANLRSLTRFQGRWQVLGENPLVLVDSAHNEGGLAYVIAALQQLAPTEGRGAARQGGRTRDRSSADSPAAPVRAAGAPNAPHLHIVLGVVNDKDLATILPLFPSSARYYFARADIPRGLPAADLQAVAAEYALEGRTYTSVRNALRAAKRAAQATDVIFVGGSIFTVAEVL